MISDTCGTSLVCSSGTFGLVVLALTLIVLTVLLIYRMVSWQPGISDEDESLLLKRIWVGGVRADELKLGTQAKYSAEYARMGYRVIADSPEIESQVREILDTIQGFDDYFGPRKDER